MTHTQELVAALREALAAELKLKNDLVLAAYPAMDAIDAIRKWCDAQKYENDLLTVCQLRAMLPPAAALATPAPVAVEAFETSGLYGELFTPITLSPTPTTARPEPDVVEDWRDDPSSDERWNAGLDYAMDQLCAYLGVDQKQVTWDAATETLDGDVRAVLGNILRVKYGENWGPQASRIPSPVAASLSVEMVECVSYESGYKEPTDPLWRIVVDGYCADFPTEMAARNFAAALSRTRL